MTVLVIADHDNEKLKDSTLNTVTAATKFNSEIHVLVAGYNCALVANAAAKINGVDKELVSKTAADIKNLKPVEPYKGKGIKEKGQFVLRKEGKKK